MNCTFGPPAPKWLGQITKTQKGQFTGKVQGGGGILPCWQLYGHGFMSRWGDMGQDEFGGQKKCKNMKRKTNSDSSAAWMPAASWQNPTTARWRVLHGGSSNAHTQLFFVNIHGTWQRLPQTDWKCVGKEPGSLCSEDWVLSNPNCA